MSKTDIKEFKIENSYKINEDKDIRQESLENTLNETLINSHDSEKSAANELKIEGNIDTNTINTGILNFAGPSTINGIIGVNTTINELRIEGNIDINKLNANILNFRGPSAISNTGTTALSYVVNANGPAVLALPNNTTDYEKKDLIPESYKLPLTLVPGATLTLAPDITLSLTPISLTPIQAQNTDSENLIQQEVEEIAKETGDDQVGFFRKIISYITGKGYKTTEAKNAISQALESNIQDGQQVDLTKSAVSAIKILEDQKNVQNLKVEAEETLELAAGNTEPECDDSSFLGKFLSYFLWSKSSENDVNVNNTNDNSAISLDDPAKKLGGDADNNSTEEIV